MYHAGYPGVMPHAPSGMPAATPMPMPVVQAATAANTMAAPGMPILSQPAVMPPQIPSGLPMTAGGTVVAAAPEQSYVENILRANLGKIATIYMTFENNSEWNAKIFKGALEAAGRDHIIISDPTTGKRYLLLTVNLDYITFDEPLNYTLPFGTVPAGGVGSLSR